MKKSIIFLWIVLSVLLSANIVLSQIEKVVLPDKVPSQYEKRIAEIKREPSKAIFVIREMKPPHGNLQDYKGMMIVLEATGGGAVMAHFINAKYGPNGRAIIPMGDGAIHVFKADYEFVLGENKSYKISGTKEDPLVFGMIDNVGYTYLQGRGNVTPPNGLRFGLFSSQPRDADDFFNLGNVAFWMKNYKVAVSHFTKALSFNPGLLGPRINRGAAFIELQDFQGAVKDFDKALALDSSSFNALYLKGVACQKDNRKAEAIQAYRTFIEEAPARFDNLKKEVRSKIQQLQAGER